MALSSGTKKLLIVFAALGGASLLACLVCGVSGFFWLESAAGEMREMGERVAGEASEFAASHTQADCLDEALRRSDACGPATEIMCHAQANAFYRTCLRLAAPSPGLCDGVPPMGEIMQGAQWSAARCASMGRAQDQSCPNLVSALVAHCSEPR